MPVRDAALAEVRFSGHATPARPLFYPSPCYFFYVTVLCRAFRQAGSIILRCEAQRCYRTGWTLSPQQQQQQQQQRSSGTGAWQGGYVRMYGGVAEERVAVAVALRCSAL